MMNGHKPNKEILSQREIERQYNKMLEHKSCNGQVAPNRFNCYRCDCGHVTKTIDVDKGVTPFIFNCDKCNKHAKSTFYNDIAPHLEPTWEWYRPTLQDTIKRRIKKPFDVDHILKGGLDYRPFKSIK
jgi:hypothetical protein